MDPPPPYTVLSSDVDIDVDANSNTVELDSNTVLSNAPASNPTASNSVASLLAEPYVPSPRVNFKRLPDYIWKSVRLTAKILMVCLWVPIQEDIVLTSICQHHSQCSSDLHSYYSANPLSCLSPSLLLEGTIITVLCPYHLLQYLLCKPVVLSE
jgi:hypothetical protein